MTARRDTRSAGRRPGRDVGAMLAFASATLVMLALAGSNQPGRTRVAQIMAVQLVDDDGGAALFAVPDFAPDQPTSRCLRVTYTGPAGQGHIRLVATGINGSLATQLQLTVAVGDGGAFGDCTGFVGSVVYTGDLNGLSGGTADQPGVWTGWSPAANDARTFQITVTLRDGNAFQAATAGATFEWVLTDAPLPPPPPPPPTTPPATPTPTPSDPTPSSPEPSSPEPTPPAPSAPAPTSPRPTLPPPSTPAVPVTPPSHPVSPPRSPSAPTPSGSRSAHPVPGSGSAPGRPGPPAASPRRPARSVGAAALHELGQAASRVFNDAARVITRMASKHRQFPVALLLALLGFLLVQDRFDRRDPKLALAPLRNEPDPAFIDPPDGEVLR